MRVVYATSTTSVGLPNGASGTIHKGTHWPADDPIVRAHPDLFSDDPRWGMNYSVEPEGYNDPPRSSDTPVEQATAAPGEKRSTRRS